jgi:tRNA(adenine34) deaminase
MTDDVGREAKPTRKSFVIGSSRLSAVVCLPHRRLSSRELFLLVELASRRFFITWRECSGSSARVMLTRNMDADLEFMKDALSEARAAAAAGEVPIGAVLVHRGKVVARSGNRTIRDCDPTAHAEMVVLREAARVLGNYRLADTTLYVTIEPCSMCAGAIIQARVPRLVFGCDDPKGGAVRSCFEVLTHPRLNHNVEVTSGVLSAECAATIQSFFAERR